MNEPIVMRVEVDPHIYPRLHKMLSEIKSSMRSEKVRQLAAMGEMIENGLIQDFAQQIQSAVVGSLRDMPIAFTSQNNKEDDLQESTSSGMKADDFANYFVTQEETE